MTTLMNDANNAGTLLPCPFCKSRCVTATRDEHGWKIVECDDCGARGPCIDLDGDQYIDRWNALSAPNAPVEREAIKSPGEAGASHNSGERDPSVMTDHSPGELSRCELRTLARLAWNGWPDNDASRKIIADHESRDKHSADAWDRVVTILALPCADEAAIRADEREKCDHPIDDRFGSGSANCDGSGSSEWRCMKCGHHEKMEWPASAIRSGGKQP